MKSDVEALKPDDIRAVLDCSAFAAGTHQTDEVEIELPPGIDARATIAPETTEVRIR